MAKRMLIDATQHEETRVAVIEGKRLEEFDYESAMRKPLKGNIFLAKVTRVEPSLQAAFVNYGGNRHGFLPFSEIHPDYFRIPVADQEEFERMQREQLEEHDKLEAEVEDEDDDAAEKADDNNDDDTSEGVEEIVDDMDISSNEDSADIKKDDDAEDSADDEADSDDDEDDSDDDDDDAEDSKDDGEDEGEDDDGNAKRRGNRRGGRGRNGRGRGGRRRSNFRSRRPENFGDDEAGQAQRFRFNLRRKYKIQEVIKRGQIMLIQVSREERGNKGAAVSSYLSLPGRYCVLMPNSPRGGGVSRKISNNKDRSKMKDLLDALKVPAGMSAIVRTAGVTRTKTEVKRDLDYLMRLWNSIRELTLKSQAPALVYEEADLIKRAVRDHYTRDIEDIIVAGEHGHKCAKDFMKMLIPSHAKRVHLYEDTDMPLFQRYQVENQIAEIGETEVTLPSGGYLVINPTEALVSIDVNSGRSTKERNIEGTALKTNLEAAEEVARQLRLRDLGGLVVIDFIDMEDRRNNGKVERKMREALSGDRARVQVGRISSFGLMELSRQRLNASLSEAQFEVCPHCEGRGRVRTADSASLLVVRAIEAEGVRRRAAEVIAHVPANVALYLLNYKRGILSEIEARYGLQILIRVDEDLSASSFRVEVSKPLSSDGEDSEEAPAAGDDEEDNKKGRRGRGRRGGRGRGRDRSTDQSDDDTDAQSNDTSDSAGDDAGDGQDESDADKPARKRGRKSTKKVTDETAGDAEKDAPKDDEQSTEKAKKPAKRTRAKKADTAEKTSDVQDEATSKPKTAAKSKSSKEKAPAKSKAKKASASNDDDPSTASEHETVNQAPKKKKSGWWSKK